MSEGVGSVIKCDVVRIYYNAENPNEPFCLDFGPGTLAMVAKIMRHSGHWAFRYSEEGDPKAWVEPVKLGVEVSIFPDISKVEVKALD